MSRSFTVIDGYQTVNISGMIGCSTGPISHYGSINWGVTGATGPRVESLEYKFGRTPISIDGTDYFNWNDWVEQLTRGDVVWLEKEKVFALIGSSWQVDPISTPTGPQGPSAIQNGILSFPSTFVSGNNGSSSSDLGQITLIKSVTYTGGKCEFKEEVWRVRSNGTGVDGSILIKPLIGWTGKVDPPAPMASKEQELCEAIDALEKEIERLKKTNSLCFTCNHLEIDHTDYGLRVGCIVCDCKEFSLAVKYT